MSLLTTNPCSSLEYLLSYLCSTAETSMVFCSHQQSINAHPLNLVLPCAVVTKLTTAVQRETCSCPEWPLLFCWAPLHFQAAVAAMHLSETAGQRCDCPEHSFHCSNLKMEWHFNRTVSATHGVEGFFQSPDLSLESPDLAYSEETGGFSNWDFSRSPTLVWRNINITWVTHFLPHWMHLGIFSLLFYWRWWVMRGASFGRMRVDKEC